jgi:penicillin V acylase-like amidase (Ntn superfamily)
MRTRRRLATLTSLGLAALIATPALSCTTVCLLDGARPVVAYNYDFDPPEGLVLVNKRGVAKRSMLPAPAAAWAAVHGSVTFNQFGRDNPTTGINERGLMISLMWLDETRYPAPDGRPAISVLEWIQYNLDRHASVAEVLANAEALRPASRVPIHYLFADATGDVAAAEFLDGRLVAHRGPTLPVRALANSTYVDSLGALGAATRRGDVPASTSSLDRFARAALLAREPAADPVARGFEILASVAQPSFTRWSIVYDLGAREVHFRTDGNRAIRRVALSELDFSCGTPVKMLDVTAGGSGDVTRDFADYTRAANRALIEASIAKTPFLQGVTAAARDALAAHPETASSCATSK